ncbi:PIH1 domain-containing protein 1 [Anoplolepis gracilipes]|uniref:PIH1 domain-containing protein 1 n=1 Tax=Anoplolepis gracilipes TaxID=354296 RepID=UPI003BA1F965
MNDAIFLDIDDSIKMKNLLLPDKDRDVLNQQMDKLMKQYNSKPFIFVQPTPGICVKTRTSDKKKIFVNICVSDKILPPEDISDTKLFELLNDEVPNYIIPMSICAERMETDKSGTHSATYDVMINKAYFEKCQEKKHFMTFTILVILSGVADKFDKIFDMENYIIFKNRTVMGKLQQHQIENRELKKPQDRKPLIEEISGSMTSTINTITVQNNDTAKMNYVILKKPLKGPAEHLIILFDMSSISVKDIVVLVNSDRINVTDKKACFYDILVPYILEANSVKAFLDYSIMVLRIDTLIKQN